MPIIDHDDEGDFTSNFKQIYDQIKSSSFNPKKSQEAEEIVNVLSNFAWMSGKVSGDNNNFTYSKNTKINIIGNIPFCLAVEREQTVTSSVANFLTLMNITAETSKNGFKKIEAVTADKDSLGDALNTVAGFGTKISNFFSSVSNSFREGFVKNSSNSNLKNILSPYSTLYYTEPTSKSFIFPYLTGDVVMETTNMYEDSHHGLLNLLGISDVLQRYTDAFSGGVTDLANIIGGSYETGNLNNYAVEMAKAYKFNTEGEEITVKFPLYNTIQRDKWKDHYKFIYLFLLRNLPMKTTIGTYIPPLLYDFIIPGLKRLPISYVSKFSAAPHGMQRLMKLNDNELPTAGINMNMLSSKYNNSSGGMSVIIPEAWVISISFKSLLSKTINTFLASSMDLDVISQDEYNKIQEDVIASDYWKEDKNGILVPNKNRILIPNK